MRSFLLAYRAASDEKYVLSFSSTGKSYINNFFVNPRQQRARFPLLQTRERGGEQGLGVKGSSQDSSGDVALERKAELPQNQTPKARGET